MSVCLKMNSSSGWRARSRRISSLVSTSRCGFRSRDAFGGRSGITDRLEHAVGEDAADDGRHLSQSLGVGRQPVNTGGENAGERLRNGQPRRSRDAHASGSSLALDSRRRSARAALPRGRRGCPRSAPGSDRARGRAAPGRAAAVEQLLGGIRGQRLERNLEPRSAQPSADPFQDPPAVRLPVGALQANDEQGVSPNSAARLASRSSDASSAQCRSSKTRTVGALCASCRT